MICQETAALFYLSAAVLEAYTTYALGLLNVGQLNLEQVYRENIAAVVSACQGGQKTPLGCPQGQNLHQQFGEGVRETTTV